ncbi:dynein axonemal heavy chain 6-like [Oncorhynchus clarkii lewisi]|uniref:dynein axonemal heavy chain 6-like n=1 Tax=Oncorhynchus clarkii lewisi TaxID=490388 RepID=UPI0039B88B5F
MFLPSKQEPLCLKRGVIEPIKHTCEASMIPDTWNYKGQRVKDVRFDAKEPDNDCVVSHIIRLRGKLGWSTEIPDRRIAKACTQNIQEIPEGTKKDPGEYVYCLMRNRGDLKIQPNPYDLQVVSVQTAKQSCQYWTVSASCIFKVSVLEDRSGEIMSVIDWLSERELFFKIFKLPLFAKFRIWKAFTIWKVTVCHSKTNKAKEILSKGLFFTDDIFLRCLVEIKGLFEMASDKTRYGDSDGAIVLTKLDKSTTYSLIGFCEAQTQQCAVALRQLHCLHHKVATLIRAACLKAAEVHGAERLFLPLSSQSTNRPLYAEVAEWRILLCRFSHFLNLIDRMFEEMLCVLVRSAVQLLLLFLRESSNTNGVKERRQKTKKMARMDASGPYIHIIKEPTGRNAAHTLSSHSQGRPQLVNKMLPDFKREEPKEEIQAVFEVNVLLTVTPVNQPMTDDVSAKGTATTELHSEVDTKDTEKDKEVSREETPWRSPSQRVKLTIYPCLDDFTLHIQQVLQGFEQVIAKQTSFNQDPNLLDLHSPPVFDLKLSVDEELEKERDQHLRPWPELELLLGTDPAFQSDLSDILSTVQRGMQGVEKHCQRLEKFCDMVETAMLTDMDGFLAGEKWSPQDIKAILAVHTESIRLMKRIETETRVNMILVRCHQYQSNCLPYPEALIFTIHSMLPSIVKKKNLELMEVIRGALKKLDKDIFTVEEFVEHLTFLSRISVQIPTLERQYQFLIQLYSMAKEYQITISPEELALYQHLVPSFQHLKSTVMICETKRDDNIFKFSVDLGKHLNQLRYELVLVKMKVNNPILLCSYTSPKVANEILQALSEEVAIYSNKAYSYTSYGELLRNSFSMKKISTVVRMKQGRGSNAAEVEAELSEVDYALTLRKMLWGMQKEWDKQYSRWRTTPFELLNVDDLQNDVSRFTQTIYMLEKGLPENNIVPILKQKVMDFKLCLPIVLALRNPYLRQRHWEDIQSYIGQFFTKEDNFTLGNLLDIKILQQSGSIGDISTTATNEATLESILYKVIDLWRNTDFRLITHQSDASTVKIIASADDVMAQLEESQTTIMSIKASRYAEPIKYLIDEWERKLNQFSHTLEEWVMCQKRWLYLEPIFSAGGIQRQLPAEAKVFLQVDQSWKEIMRRTDDRPNALRAATAPGVLEMLQAGNVHLEKIQKCLEDYFESKRSVFARFYFLSNEELLDVLSQSKNPNAIQPHLVKCFSNIRHLNIQEHARLHHVVASIRSAEGETVTMPKNVQIRGPVEQWMGNVETAMYNTVKRRLKIGVSEWNPQNFKKWVLSHPGQVVLTVTQIMFTKDCQESFSSERQLESMVVVKQQVIHNVEELADLVSEPLPCHQQATLEALLTILVHCRDILSHLLQNRITSVDDFEWTRQLQYVWYDSTSLCYVVHAQASFMYGYEYLGCSPRLVITPLTDRCWLTLTGALSLHLGGAPAGPSGTGKTETVKDLAKALGKFCLVLNCSDSLDYKMMGKLFSGMVQSGSWCCFDEFNRINVEVLSVIAAQLQSIKAAMHSHSLRFMFEGRDIRLNASCGFFITMNPGCKGRVDLPDNLKSLFRPVSMMVPDFDLIAEIMLFSEGFKSAKSLSRKIVNLYQLASKQLSQQDHYDFGMRAIKSVLVLAGQKRRFAALSCGLTPEDECCVLICALQNSNLPKLVPEDVPLFKSIMEDLFPGVVNPKTIHPQLEIAIAKATEILGFQQWPNQAEKVTQLYSQILARGGVMLIGPTGGGKTTVRLILQHALHLLPSLSEVHRRTNVFMELAPSSEVHVESFTINPKCVSFGELYGQVDPNTLEWSDGLFASAVRTYAKELFEQNNKTSKDSESRNTSSDVLSDSTTPLPPSSYQHNFMVDNWRWIIMDGPVDILWVENLNTVLDDNKTLCLVNGERISLPDGIRFLFEVDTLSQATPATISRCAMVYMDPVDLGWKPYVRRWLSQLPRQLSREGRNHIQQLFDNSITQGLNFVKKHQKLLNFQIPEMSTVMTVCSILGALINFMQGNGGLGLNLETLSEEDIGKTSADNESTGKGEDNKWFLQKNPEKLTILLGKLFVFSYAWAVGGVLNHVDDYDESPSATKDKSCHLVNVAHAFKNLIHKLFEGAPCGVSLPAGNRMIFNYFVDLQTGAFVPWDELVPSTESLIRKGLNTSSGSESLQLGGALGESNTTDTTSFLRSGPICSNDTVRYSFLMSLLLLNRQPVLLTGDSGVGKTILIQSILKKLQRDGGEMVNQGTMLGRVFLHNQSKTASLLEDVNLLTAVFGGDADKSTDGDSLSGLLSSMPFGVLHRMRSPSHTSESSGILTCTLQCTARTTTAYIQAHMLQNLVKKGKNNLGAPKNKSVLVFVDDLNMPTLDSYGAQPSMEFIRQFIELQGVFDAKTLTWKGIQDVTLCAACAPPGGGRQNLSPRLLRHFSVLLLPHPSSNTMQHIFQVQLGKFFGIRDFSKEVRKCREALVSASITVYNEMCQRMMPTPAKYHYTFNLRDLSKVVQGLMQASDSELNSEEAAAYLFSHETSRVFHDRLVNEQDRELFFQILSNELHSYFKVSWPPEELMREPIAFGDFLDMSIPTASRIYKHLPELKKIQAVLEECHASHGRKASQFPMVFFREAVEHITRAARVFRLKGAHMMLIGLDGTGKEECVTLACHVSGSHLYRLSVCRNCSYSDFRDDLKKVFRQAGIQRKNTVLLITDSDIVKESVLEDLNCILKYGDVPGLFDNDEIDSITVDLKSTMESSIGENREEMYSYFIEQVHQRLHIVLALSPAGMRLRQYCWAHPALLSCCNIDWYSEWSKDALLQVANSTYINSDHFDWLGQVLQNKVARVCVDIHQSSTQMAAQYLQEMRRPYYIVPSTFIEYIDTFTKMCRSEGSKLHNVRDRFSNGLSILSEATSLVTVMQDELLALGPQIEEKSKEIEILMGKLKEDSQAVEQVRAIVKIEEDMMVQETRIVHEYAEDATADLNKVLPLLEKAVSALDALQKSDISEIRVYTKPPELVLTVMHAVCILLQQRPDWTTAKQLLGDPGFLKRLVSLDKDSLPEKVFLKLRRYSKCPDFNPAKVGLVSIACRSMCLWVLALEHYHEVYKIIEPKRNKVNVAQAALVKSESNLMKKQKRLSKIEEHQKALEDRYDASVSERQELGRRKERTTNRVQRAASLISALSNEKDRWEKAVCDLDNKLQHIVGDVMVSSAFITYCGPLTADYRKAMVKKWLDFCHNMEIPVSPQYTFTSAMTEKNQVRHWQNTGLPPDQNSTENALIVKNGPHWPLLIDPQGQATRWISSMEGVRLRKMLASDPNYMKTVERAIRMGDAVLIQDVLENIDPCLQPILIKNLTIRDGQSFIKIGDTEIEYNPNFRLYLATCLPNPHFLPAVCVLVKLINFSVEYECLQEQLLSSAVSLYQPELELHHNQLLHTITADLFSLHELENRSLLLLQDTQGHILDDQDLVDNLKKSKVTSNEISVRVETAKDKEKEIDEVRKKYLPIANRGADLYFVLADLTQINYMYQFSLDWFNDMYVKALQVATEGQEWPTLDVSMPVTGTLCPAGAKGLRRAVVVPGTCAPNMGDFNLRLLKMMNAITESIYKEVSLALFVDDQVVFSFLMCCNIMKTNKHNMIVGSTEFLPAEEWKIFLHSAVLASMMDSKRAEQEEGELLGERPDHPWLTDSMWAQCQYLCAHLPCFATLYKSIQTNRLQWELFQQARNLYEFLSEPYTGHAGSGTEGESSQSAAASKDRHLTKCVHIFPWESLSGFQKILLVKILRPECLNTAVKAFVIEKMGSKYLEVGKISLREVYERCSANVPIVFLLSPGMDPASLLVRLAQELRGSSLHLDMVSLGQGQGPRAEELIYKAQVLKGRWVFLQNCHLAASFMPRLQTVVNSLKWKGSDLDPHFRLWLSSKPDPVFPASVLQRAIKIAVEPPRGLKEKLLHTFSPSGEVTERSFCKMDCSPAWKTLLFSLCFFNAIVQERKKYGPLGWNIPYTFTSSDLEVSMLNQESLLRAAEGSELPWAALRYLTGEVIYGGRVTDPWDRRCLLTILHRCYTPSVLQDGHSFCQAQGYPPFPKDASWPQCRAYIENMPDKDLAEVFGIDSSAETVILQNQTQQLLHTIVNLQPRLSDSSLLVRDRQCQDSVVLRMAMNILKKLPETVEVDRVTEKTLFLRDIIAKVNFAESSSSDQGERCTASASSALLVILRQEIDQFNYLLCVVRSSLLSFSASIRGEVLMSEALEEVYTALLTMIVPSDWKHCSYESCMALGSWIQDLEQRVWFFRAWADNIKINLIEKIPIISGGVYSLNRPPKTDLQQSLKNRKPRSYWLSGFFFPQGFLTAVLQNSARQKNVPVDSLSFTYHVQPVDESWSKVADKTKLLFEGPAPPDEGVLVYGLYLDGASWDPVSHTLQELQHNIKHCPVPEIHFLPCQVSEDAVAVPTTESPGDLQFYDCPLYRTFKRAGFLSSSGISTNFITSVSLPTLECPTHWVFRGTALLCQPNE